MTIKKTLGGDRLGSGKKMEVEFGTYGRSNHDMSKIVRTTAAPGTLMPIDTQLLLPGDTIDINLDTQVMTLPTDGPLFGSFRLQIDVFMAPIRLYQALLHNNKRKIGLDIEKVKLPQLKVQCNNLDFENRNVPLDIQQINSSSLLAYLGIRGIGWAENTDNRR